MAFALDELRLAFQLHVVDLVVQDDQITTDAEAAFLSRAFPAERLQSAGFVDANGRTARFQEAAVRALDVLPSALDDAEKRDLLERCFAAAMADEVLRIGEASVVLMASRLLGVSDEAFDAFLVEHGEAHGVTVELLDRGDGA